MSKIIHMSLDDFENALHDDYQVAIRIADNTELLFRKTVPKAMTYMSVFSDCNRGEKDYPTHHKLSMIADALKDAKRNNLNVVVHCVMGVSRSAAIAQAAIDFLEFDDGMFNDIGDYKEFVTKTRPHINKDIYNDMRKVLGFTQSWEE